VLERAPRDLGDLPSGLRRAGEVDHRDAGMRDERLADVDAAGDDVQQPGGEAGGREHLGERQAAGDRGLGRRLEDDGVAERERGGDDAHAEDEREVPRRDDADDPARAAEAHQALSGVAAPLRRLLVVAAELRRLPVEDRDEVARLDQRLAVARLALLAAQQVGERVRALGHDAGDARAQIRALEQRHLGPGRQRAVRRGDRAACVLAPALRRGAEGLGPGGVDQVVRLSRRGVGPFPVDVHPAALHAISSFLAPAPP
jgi:hypothetical protein